MNILVTGVSGFLGIELATYLKNHTIIGLDIKEPDQTLPDNVTFIHKSILDSDLSSICDSYSIEVCVHLAWTVTPVHGKNRKNAYNVDYNGTKNVFTACKTANVKHIIFMSSTLAYGALPGNPEQITEDEPLKAKKSFHYAYHKRIVEYEIVQPFIQENPTISVTVVRAPGFLGPTVHNYVSSILRSKILPVMIGGRNTRIQFLHIEDLLDTFDLIVQQRISGIYNIAPDKFVAMKNLPKLLPGHKVYIPESLARLLINIAWSLHLYNAPSSYLDFVRYEFIASNEKLKKKFNWTPKYSTEDAIKSLNLLPKK